jgi:hypothetical protein
VVRSMAAPRGGCDNLGGSTVRPSTLLTGLCVGAVLASLSFTARADDDDQEDYPLQYAQRPLTLHAQSLSPYVSADVTRFVADPNAVKRDLGTNLTVQGGAKFGITKALEVEAALAQIQILPKLAYGNPTLGATFRFINSAVEIGVRGKITIVTASATAGMIAEPSVPVQIHIGKSVRLDFSAGLPITIARGAPTVVGLDLPVAFALNLVDTLHAGAQTSVYIADFKDPGKSITVPLGFFAGFSIGTEHPIVEIDPFFTWPKFAQPGATDPGAQKLNIDVYTAGLAVRGYVFF